MERPFLIFYSAHFKDHSVTGEIDLVSQDGSYIKRCDIVGFLETEGMSNIVITNIIELTESDYSDYIYI